MSREATWRKVVPAYGSVQAVRGVGRKRGGRPAGTGGPLRSTALGPTLIGLRRTSFMGAEGAWWPHRSSKPAGPAKTRVGGFDSHTFPPHMTGPGPEVQGSGPVDVDRDLCVTGIRTAGTPPHLARTGSRPALKLRHFCLIAALGSSLGATALAAQVQDPPPVVPGTAPAALPDSLPGQVTPTGAFLRALALPGWGHAAIGSNLRGAFYVAAEGGTAWMLLRIHRRLGYATRQLDLREDEARARLAAEGITDPAEIAEALEDDETLDSPRNLLSSRQQQREDWLAFGIFLMLLSGADAFVSAHLQDFPAQPVFAITADDRVELGIRIPLGNR